MAVKYIKERKEPVEDQSLILKWGKFITRVTAISATVTGVFAALFSSSSFTSGVALTAAGASTLAAAEKLPSNPYIKTKHIPPRPILQQAGRKILPPDILPQPEKIAVVNGKSSAAKSVNRPAASFERPRNS